ncbi:MAG: hypothetical protein AB7I27_05280 [Bacteriovoracaceae bacterium]
MRKLLFLFSISLSFLSHADVYLQNGQSQWVRGDMVYCGYNQPTERNFTCTYSACLKSESVHHYNVHNCEFFKGYKIRTLSVWAMSGSEAEAILQDKLHQDNDITDFKPSTIQCR